MTVRLLEQLSAAAGAERSSLFTSSFVFRAVSGPVKRAPAEEQPLDGDLRRLIDGARAGELESVGSGFVLVQPSPSQAPLDQVGWWVVRVWRHRLAAAFEFTSREDAVAALPPRLRPRTNLALVSEAIWAFVHRDISKLLSSLAEDFVYTDLEHGATLEGGSNAVGQLLMSHGDLSEAGLVGLELNEPQPAVIDATGLLSRSEPGEEPSRWRWQVSVGISEGRIQWAVRAPNELLEG